MNNSKITTSADVRLYLNRLSEIKDKTGKVEKQDGLYIIFDKENLPLLTCTEQIYKIFEEL